MAGTTVYVDELSEELNKCNVGCNLNGHLINHIMYADDLVLISPSSAGPGADAERVV